MQNSQGSGISRRPPIDALTGLRFFAASHIVFLHYFIPVIRTGPDWAYNLFASGQTAVALFYVLSGFVLAWSTTGVDGKLRSSRRSFWLARFARIYPIYAVAALIYGPQILQQLVKQPPSLDWLHFVIQAVLTFTAAQAWVPSEPLLWNAPGWSISVEAFFYLLFPFICVPLLRIGRSTAIALIVGLFFVDLLPRVAFVVASFDGGQMPADNFSQTWVTFWTVFPMFRLPEFAIGICLARIVIPLRNRSGAKWTFLLALALTAFIVVHMLMGTPTLQFLVIWLILPFAVVLIGLLASTHNPITRLLSSGPLVVLGEASYGTYILQEPVNVWMRTIGKRITGIAESDLVSSIAFFLIFYSLLLVLSVFSHRFFEVPIRRLITGRLASSKSTKFPVVVIPEAARN